jgi:tight adherence protein B
VLDAAVRSSELVGEAKLPSGSVVLLSDGADHGSRSSLEDVRATSAATGVRVYTVGLRSAQPDFGTLNLVAATTHGEFSATSSVRDLARIYGRLGSLLAHQYVIRYRSPAAPGAHVRVEARVTGFSGVASAVYTAPAAPLGRAAPFHHAPAETLWLRPGAALGVSIACAVFLLLGLWIALRPRAGSLRGRVAEYVNPAEPEPERPRRADPGSASRFAFTQSARRDGFRDGLRQRLDVGRIAVPAERLIGWTAGTTLLLLIMLPLITGTMATVLLALAVPIGVRAYIEQCVRRQRRLFTEQLPDNLQVMASAMRAGHSFAGALTVVADDAPEPTRREFQRVIADERLGVPVDEALGAVVRRMDSKDLEQVALVAALQRETGGNTAEVLERVTDTVRERVAVRRMIQTLTAQGRMSRWVLTAIPIALLAFITVINPTYVHPLYHEPLGQFLLVLAGLMIFSGSIVIKRIVDIKV